MFDHAYKITYEKEFDRWRLVEHGMIKGSTQRAYESKKMVVGGLEKLEFRHVYNLCIYVFV